MAIVEKRAGYGLEFKHIKGRDGNDYLVFRTSSGEFHIFVEVEAKTAAIQCSATDDRTLTTQQLWGSVWAAS